MRFLHIMLPFLLVMAFMILQVVGQKINKIYDSINFNTRGWTKVFCALLSVFFYCIGLEIVCIFFGSIVVFD
jgi:L-asparagine transporter-like permease